MNYKPSVSITIDIKNYRLRIHKLGLHLLKDPKHIQILVSVAQRKLVIKPATKDTPQMQTIKIENKRAHRDNSIDIHSACFCESLMKAIGLEDTNYSYRIAGEHLPNEDVLAFSFDAVTRIEN